MIKEGRSRTARVNLNPTDRGQEGEHGGTQENETLSRTENGTLVERGRSEGDEKKRQRHISYLLSIY